MSQKHLYSITIIYITILFVGVNLCFGQNYWKKSYGSNAVFSIQSIDDGNFLMVGNTQNNDCWIVKIKPNGDTVWSKTYVKEPYSSLYSISATSDDNFMIAGFSGTGWLLKIKPNGDTLFTKTYNGKIFYAIQTTSDGNFLLVGSSQSDDTERCCAVKIKPDGETIWSKTYDKGNFYGLQPLSDNNSLLVGLARSSDGINGYAVKINSNGDTIWTKKYSRSNMEMFYSVQISNDGNFLLAGNAESSSIKDANNGWVVKIKPNGDTLWTKTYKETSDNCFLVIQPTGDGNFMLAGSAQSGDTTCGWIVKISPNGTTIWTKLYSETNYTDFKTIMPTRDGNFLVGSRGGISVACIIADQYAYKNISFIYKIPTYSTDTLNFGYVPLKVPSGMTVSTGGTVSWIPKTDSVYMDNAEFLVFNDMGRKDTLSFNIFVNADYQTPVLSRPSQTDKTLSNKFDISTTSFPGYARFYLPPSTSSLCIYDITGRIVDKISIAASSTGSSIVWPGNKTNLSGIHAGKYFAKVASEKISAVKSFVLVM